MELSKIEELGLTKHEATVYKALLELGETKTGAIVKITTLHRVLIYDALESLIKKGLASYVIKENIKYFKAADPERLLDFLKEKQETAEELIPELKTIQKKSLSKQSVEIYETVVGLKSAFRNMLKELTSKDYHYVFASGNMAEAVGDYYYSYQKEKHEKHIVTHIIYDVSFRQKKEVIKITYGKIRFFPLGPFPTDTWIYKDKVLIVNYTTKPPVAILITSQETADSYKRIFEGYWKQAKV
ncbi:hypothetical protein HY450_03940 [Candidatus Pacearchaeota archaeon]|nr:hypothetical protein [Candidatus Pacearchaeota archaeon]